MITWSYKKSVVTGIFILLMHTMLFSASITVFPGYQRKIDPSHKHFVIIVPSYNNQEWYLQNLQSIINQEYDNFEVIYLDDCSSDNTADLVEAYIREHQPSCPITLIRNARNDGPAANRYRAMHLCDDNSIMVFVDGDDWLIDNQVLTYLNTLYQDKEVWMTYGQHQQYPSGQHGWTSATPDWVIRYNFFRHYGWIFGHLRTAYAWLGKQVKLVDMLYDGTFISMATDIALFLPMMEMAGGHLHYAQKELYVYNRETSLNMHTTNPTRQRSLDKIIRQRKSYTPLKHPLTTSNQSINTRTALLILSYGDTSAVEKIITEAQQQINDLDTIYVVYHTNDKTVDAAYQQLQYTYSIGCFNLRNSVKQGLLDCLTIITADYILCADDTSSIVLPITSSACTQVMRKTDAYAFHLTRALTSSTSLPAYNYIDTDIYAWQYANGNNEWYRANSLDMTLYRKDTLLEQWRMIPFSSLAALKKIWEALHFPEKIGLFLQPPDQT